MTTKKRWILPLIFAAFVAYIIYATVNLDEFRCNVCMEFDGEKACRTASGSTRDDAVNTAKENACAQLTSGMGNVRRCLAQEPASVEWLE